MAKKQKSTEQQLMVALRIRPIFPDELYKGAGHLAHKVDKKMVVLLDPHAGNTTDVLRAKRAQEKRYVFDYAFDASSTQEEVYKCTAKKLVENVMEGYNGTVFAYGATGAGKTYTMVGTDRDPGVMVRALRDLFQVVKNKSDTTTYDVTMSYLEIYNENIRDLLNPSSGHLDLREDSHGNHQVAGLSEISVKDENAVMKMLVKGNKNRTQEATGANKTSSRSHAMLQVHVKQQDRLRNTVQEVRTGKLYMVDLAGSERASHTRNTGQRLKEGKHINKSLLALGNCINALAVRGAKYINFRDSKLTRLLKEPLCGNCYTVMIAHISPAAVHFDESRNTLVYADRAKNIKNKVRSNVQDVSQHVAQYETIISELRQEIQRLRSKLEGQNDPKPSESCQKMVEGKTKQLKDEVIESFNQQMEVRRRIMEIDNSLLNLGTEFGKTVLILNEWERSKAKQGLKHKDILCDLDQGKENLLMDTDIPEYVRQAWEDIEYIQAEQQRFMALREDTEREYEDCCGKTYRLAEELPGKVSTDEEREILNLLTRVHELEIQSMVAMFSHNKRH